MVREFAQSSIWQSWVCVGTSDKVLEPQDHSFILSMLYSLTYPWLFAFAGIEVWNPAFDVTPHQLITGGIITELGVFLPSELQAALTGRLTAL